MRRSAPFTTLLLVMIPFFGNAIVPARVQAKHVTSAAVGNDGLIHIHRGDGTEFVALRVANDLQVSVNAPVIANDGRTVGWLVNVPNCCTSYPIPMRIFLYRDGHIIRRISNGRAIFRFHFVKGGKQIAYFSNSVHGNLGPECVLVSVHSGKKLGDWTRGDGPLPSWAEVFAFDVGPVGDRPKQ